MIKRLVKNVGVNYISKIVSMDDDVPDSTIHFPIRQWNQNVQLG